MRLWRRRVVGVLWWWIGSVEVGVVVGGVVRGEGEDVGASVAGREVVGA